MFRISRKKIHNAVDAKDFLSGDKPETDDDGIETKLSVPDAWNLSQEERYVYAFHNSQSPKLKKNQISIYSMELSEQRNGSLLATGLVRNTVPKNIKFGKTMILLLGTNNEPIAKREFDLGRLGVLPPNTARPWKFVFAKEHMLKEVEILPNSWSLAFEVKRKHQLDLDESWEKSVDDETKKRLEKLVEQAQPLKPGEVNFMGIQAKQTEKGELAVTLLIRNGSEKNVNLQQIPLGVKDASGEEIACGGFKLDNFTVKANTSKPWTFIFPKSLIKRESIDLSKWQVYPLQKN